jgi:hypothetical protein
MRLLVFTVGALLLTATAAHAVEKDAIDKAIDNGVAALKRLQRNDGTWPHEKLGATALAGLTLLECGVKDDDKAVVAAANVCRKRALTTLDTYSLSLIVIFLDRLDKPEDTPIIEACIVNILAGQNTFGGWDYNCVQAFGEQELKAVLDESSTDDKRELKGSRDLSKLPAKGKRDKDELPRTVKEKIAIIARSGGNTKVMGALGDNSNTQFATLGLWAGRRYGVPTQAGLLKIDDRYRNSQIADGSWGYSPPPKVNGNMGPTQRGIGSAAMTCAGLLGLACGHGAKGDAKKNKDGKVSIDVSADKSLNAGLAALATAVGEPVGWKGTGQAPDAVSTASGKAYYYLWSLERVCVVLGLETLGKKDWYNWGAEVLLKSQRGDGSWGGEYAESGADTCFALLFLKKANLLHDLSSSIKSVKDPGERKLKSGGFGGDSLKGKKRDTLMPVDVGSKPTKDKDKKEEKKALTEEQKKASKLADDLVGAKGKEREQILEKLRDTKSKGGEYTEALVEVIPKLDAETKKMARGALADRLTRMKAETLKMYLKEDDPELRRAAAIAVGQKDAKILIPELIDLLSDEDAVRAGARASLKAMAGKDLGDNPEVWRLWWKKQAKE